MNGGDFENHVTGGGLELSPVWDEPLVEADRQLIGRPVRSAAVPAEVRLVRHGQHLHVEPPVPDTLDVLRTRLRALATGRDGRSVLLTVPWPMHMMKDTGGTPTTLYPAGLEPAVRVLLERGGYKVRIVRYQERRNRMVGVVDPPAEHLPEPAAETLFKPYITDRPLIDCVRKNDRARIRYEPETVDPAALVAQIARAWPGLTILVLSTRRRSVHALRRRLHRLGIEATGVTGQNNPALVGRVAIATYGAISHSPLQADWRDIVIALNGIEAVGKKPFYVFGYASRARWYGLVAEGICTSPYEDDALTQLFGFDEVYIPKHFCHETLVEVVHCRMEGGPRLPHGLEALDLKRRGLWHHPLRNRRIASLARLLLDGDVGRLLHDFPTVARGLAGTAARGVFVVVENIEHGLALANKLPGWPLIAGATATLHGLPDSDVALIRAGEQARQTRPSFAIVTAAGMHCLHRPTPSVIVRADGGIGLTALGSLELVQTNSFQPRRLVLVDFDDRHHPVLRQKIRSRREAYIRRGWFPVHTDPVQMRVARFLAARPSGVRP